MTDATQTLTEPPHPPPAKLSAYGLGLLDERESQTIESHLSECNTCCDALKGLSNDPFVARLRPGEATLSSAATIHILRLSSKEGP